MKIKYFLESGFYWEFAGEWGIDYLDCGEEFRKEEDIVVRGNINENKDLYDKILKDDENDDNDKDLMNSIVGKKNDYKISQIGEYNGKF